MQRERGSLKRADTAKCTSTLVNANPQPTNTQRKEQRLFHYRFNTNTEQHNISRTSSMTSQPPPRTPRRPNRAGEVRDAQIRPLLFPYTAAHRLAKHLLHRQFTSLITTLELLVGRAGHGARIA